MGACTTETGALVFGGSVRIMPGNRKSKGETVRDALTPPHPAQSGKLPASKAKPRKFQHLLTCRV
jgi:hypothetical protein